MGEQRLIGAEERRARLATRHRLAGGARATAAEEVATSLVALHGTDPATVFLAVGARLADGGPDPVADTERALYEERTLVRMHGMRHTVFVVPSELAAAVHSSSEAAGVRERARLVKQLAEGSDYDEAWLAETERLVLAELAARGEATGAELGAAVPRLRATYVYGVGTRQEGPQTVGTRVLRILGMRGLIVRGRPQGGWTSNRFRWSPAPNAPGAGVTGTAPAPVPSPAEARAELVRHWLAAYGPATEADLKWWTGWTLTDVRRALSALGAVRVTLGGALGGAGGTGAEAGRPAPGFVLPDDLDPVPSPAEPWAALLPALDPTAMGWQDRDWYLDPAHRPPLFDRSGNIGPTVWWNGRIVGGWAQRPDGEIVWRLLPGAGGDGTGRERDRERDRKALVRAVEAEAARLAGRLGAVRVTPRFRTPLEKELSGG
ncbi:winged helix DNA-binding domain-containing protein [Streptomyces sp. NPDC048718]|uniref:winged helix DNA-binding domain-containing protein n=1 Tax=Streptomyces sp. NPDC048718 TaxID=3365587 RepID=UPI003712E22B